MSERVPELKSCRFCHHDGDGIQYCLPDLLSKGITHNWQVCCLNCGTYGPISDQGEAGAAELWNAPENTHHELVEALKGAVKTFQLLTNADKVKTSNPMQAYTQCVATEIKCRKAISRAKGESNG